MRRTVPLRLGNGAKVAGPGPSACVGRTAHETLWRLGLPPSLSWAASSAIAADKVTFGTNWLAEAEHGGYYQAVVDGTYAKYGLDVTIVQGGPQANNGLLLAAGRLDFYMGGNLLLAFDAVDSEPADRRRRRAFPERPANRDVPSGRRPRPLERSAEGRPAYIGKEGLASFFRWMETEYGFKEENVRPYAFNPAPFIADKNSIQQGYVTSEPFAVEREGHFKPNIFLLADQGYSTYATTVENSRRRDRQPSRHRPALRRRFDDRLVPLSLRRQR